MFQKYECEDCTDCPYKDKCTKAKGNRKMQVSKKFIEKRHMSYENIISRDYVKHQLFYTGRMSFWNSEK